MANQNEQGTGKHGHKDTQEPYPHHGQQQGGSDGQRSGANAQQAQGDGSGHQGGGSEDPSLKEREYRDEQGNVHHHTKTYMEQHEKGGSGGDKANR